MKYSIIKNTLIILLLLVFQGCKEDPERHLKLGKWYVQKGLIEEAILEFKEVTRLYSGMYEKINRDQIALLSEAHYNLSLMYTKKDWWDFALKEAEKSFELRPIKDSYDLVSLIKKRIDIDKTDSN